MQIMGPQNSLSHWYNHRTADWNVQSTEEEKKVEVKVKKWPLIVKQDGWKDSRWHTQLGKEFGNFFFIKEYFSYDPQIPLGDMYPPKIKTYVHTKAWIWTGSRHAAILARVDLVHTIVKFPSRNTRHFLVYRHDNFMHHLHCFYYSLSFFFFFFKHSEWITQHLSITWMLPEQSLSGLWACSTAIWHSN